MKSPVKTFIFGAGDLGREILGWICADASEDIQIEGFIDDGQDLSRGCELPILSLNEASRAFPGSAAILAVSSPECRKAMAQRLYQAGMKPFTYVHPSVIFGSHFSLGEGSILSPRAIISSGARIGRFCLINCACTIGHDTEIGDFVTFLGSNVINGGVRIEEGCLIGSGAIIHPRVRIGQESVVGIGSIVLRNVRPGTTVFGNPAKSISD